MSDILHPSFEMLSKAEREKKLKQYAADSDSAKDRESSVEDVEQIGYNLYDSPLNGYESSFYAVTPGADYANYMEHYDAIERGEKSGHPEFFRKYIESELAFAKGKAIGVELGGQGSRLFRDFTPKFFAHTYGLNLADRRSPKEKHRDLENNHTVIAGDMFEEKSLGQLEGEVGKQNAHLFIERMGFGGTKIPLEPVFIGKYLKRLYTMLAEQGLMFIELPPYDSVVPSTHAWITKLGNSKQFNVQMANAVFRLQRLHESPSELPLLSTKEQLRVQKLYIQYPDLDNFISHVEEVFD